MFHILPPVGNRVSLYQQGSEKCTIESLFEPYKIHLFHSGTAALAAAVKIAIAHRGNATPEVLLPAYGCPDLISAVLHAGAKPVLVDLHKNAPWLDHEQLLQKITERSVAIIGVNFLGVEERMGHLREIADNTGILLIEDSAQCLLNPASDALTRGDLIIQSFGRGKPVSLLGGGAVLYRDKSFGTSLRDIASTHTPNTTGRLSAQFKIRLYNALLSPYVYGLAARLPFLSIGTTRFKPLLNIAPASFHVELHLAENIGLYRRHYHGAQEWIGAMLARVNAAAIVDLTRAAGVRRDARLLRYPILVTDGGLRERLYRSLQESGLGVSKMYPTTLPDIRGLEKVFDRRERYPNAELFACRILTLPTHHGVTRHHVEKMEEIFMQATDIR